MKEEFKGLTSNEVRILQEKYGFNQLIKEEKLNPIKKFFYVFKEPMFLLLIIAASVYFILGEPREGIIMLVFVLFVVGITFVQEWKTEKSMRALKDLTSPQVMVLRNGRREVIKSFELVPGDIIYLTEGDRIPADCEVLQVSNFSVDESILTGESEPVYKIPIKMYSENNDYWKKNILYAGTLSIFGKCTAKVKLTGVNTEYGKIGKAISETKEGLTPLQKKIGILVKRLIITGLILCCLVVGVSYLYNGDILQSILAGVSLAMAIIPEEFPVILTIFLSMGAYRLAKNNTLMRKVSAVETLGSTTVLCVDKTGTITENRMSVTKVYSNEHIRSIKDFNEKELSDLLVLACEKDPYDPMEKAIINIAKINSDISKLYNYELVKKFSFDSKTKRMANVYKINEKNYIAVKGAAETVLSLCDLSENDLVKVKQAIDEMADMGLRVLALASGNSVEVREDLNEYTLEFKGLIGLQDPPKEGIDESIALCRNAGIRVVMITGDYSKTAIAIGKQIGLSLTNNSITGEIIDECSDEELSELVKECDVFSRVIPEHKMKIIKALKNNGEIVAMTGDGVNDAPALKNADIGIAMGKRGTEVAKEAAHMILMDDNFTTIVKAVKDGRRVFDNIRKAIVYTLIIHIPIAAVALFAPMFNLPQLLLPMHIMILELIIDPTCSIIFEGEPSEPYIMEQPPRSPSEPLLTKELTIKVILQGITMFLATFLSFHVLIDSGSSVEYARSFSLIVLIIANVILVLVNRSNSEYLFKLFNKGQNSKRVLINGVALIMLFAIIYIPFLQALFQTAFIGGDMLVLAITIGSVSTGWWELVKFAQNKYVKKS